MNRFLITRLILPFVLLSGLGYLAFSLGGQEVTVDSSAETLLSADARNKETFDKFHHLIPDTVMVMVALEMDDLFSDRGASVIAQASETIFRLGGAVDVKSLTHSGRPIRQGLGLEIKEFIPLRASPDEWSRIRAFCTHFPMSRNVLVSEDGRYAVLVGVFQKDLPDHDARDAFRMEFDAAMEPLRSQVSSLHVLAFPFIEAEGYNALVQDLRTYLLFASLLILIVLFLTFRSPLAVLYVLLVETAGVLMLMEIFAIFERPVDLFTGILFPLVSGLQLTFVVHYLAAMQRAGRLYPAPIAARHAFWEVFRPSSVAALTTLAGLLTLGLSDLPTVSDFGRLGAIGVTGIFLITFLVPSFLAGSSRGSNQGVEAFEPPPWASIPGRLRKAILAGMVVVTLVFLWGMRMVRTDVRAVEFLDPENPIRQTLELLNGDLGGINIFQVQVESEQDFGMQTLPVLAYLEDIRQHAYTLPGVSDAYAYSQLYIALNQIWQGGTAASETLPSNPMLLIMFSNLLNQSPLLFKDAFVGDNARSSLFILRSRDMPGKQYLDLLERFMDYAESRKPEGITLNPVKGLHSILEGDRQIVSNQTRTLFLSLFIIALMLALLWRSVRFAAWVLLATLPALAAIFGLMGYTGFPLNSVTVMVAAVILGIAVDDGIHLVTYFQQLRQQGESASHAMACALAAKLRPMACTSSILVVFLGLLLLASFPPVAHFGILSSAGLLLAFLGACLVLPALLSRDT